MRHLRGTKYHQRCGGHERRMQALRQRHPVQRHHHDAAADHADHRAERGLADELDQHMQDRAFTARDQLDQHQGEEHRERIVGAGFDLQGRTDARPQPQPLGMDQ